MRASGDEQVSDVRPDTWPGGAATQRPSAISAQDERPRVRRRWPWARSRRPGRRCVPGVVRDAQVRAGSLEGDVGWAGRPGGAGGRPTASGGHTSQSPSAARHRLVGPRTTRPGSRAPNGTQASTGGPDSTTVGTCRSVTVPPVSAGSGRPALRGPSSRPPSALDRRHSSSRSAASSSRGSQPGWARRRSSWWTKYSRVLSDLVDGPERVDRQAATAQLLDEHPEVLAAPARHLEVGDAARAAGPPARRGHGLALPDEQVDDELLARSSRRTGSGRPHRGPGRGRTGRRVRVRASSAVVMGGEHRSPVAAAGPATAAEGWAVEYLTSQVTDRRGSAPRRRRAGATRFDDARRLRRPPASRSSASRGSSPSRPSAASSSARSPSPTPGCSAGRPTTSCSRPSATARSTPVCSGPSWRCSSASRSCAPSASSRAGSARASCSTGCRRTTAAPSPASTSRSRWSGTSATRPASCSPTRTPTSRPPGARSRRCRWRSGTVAMMVIAVAQMFAADVVLALVGLLVFPAVIVGQPRLPAVRLAADDPRPAAARRGQRDRPRVLRRRDRRQDAGPRGRGDRRGSPPRPTSCATSTSRRAGSAPPSTRPWQRCPTWASWSCCPSASRGC